MGTLCPKGAAISSYMSTSALYYEKDASAFCIFIIIVQSIMFYLKDMHTYISIQ